MPAAKAMAGDQVPEAQRWNCLPPIQFHWPSWVQAVPAEYPEPPSLPPLAGGAAEEAGVVFWAGSEGCVVVAGAGLLAADV